MTTLWHLEDSFYAAAAPTGPAETQEEPVAPTRTALRTLPAPANARTICEGCGLPIVWAITVASPTGRGGKMMPLDPVEDLAGNVAVTVAPGGRLNARVTTADEKVDRPVEYSGMTHFATCPTRTRPEIPEQVLPQPQERRPAQRRRGGRW